MLDHDYPRAGTRTSESSVLLARVCFLTIGMVLCTMLGASITWVYPSPYLMIGALIGVFVMLFVCRAVAHRYPVNIGALALFAALEGMFLGPALLLYAKTNGPLIIVQAAALAIMIFAMVGTLGYTSSRSYAHWLPWLIGGLWVLLIAGLVLCFVTFSPGAHLLYAAGGAVLFTVFIFVDFTRIRHNFGAEDYIPATMEVYLDLINLFLFILRLLSRRD